MMSPQWRETFKLWAQTAEYARHLQNARERIENALARSRQPYVSFSGGKDSTVMMHLVLQQDPDVTVWHWYYGKYFVPEDIEAQVIAIAKGMNALLAVETSERYDIEKRDAMNIWGHEFFTRVAPRMVEEGYDRAFIGIRAEESLRRKRRVRARRNTTAIPETWPLEDWRWQDVWAYIVQHHLPYLEIYDAQSELVGYQYSRFSTFFDPQFLHIGTDTVDNVLHWRWRNVD